MVVLLMVELSLGITGLLVSGMIIVGLFFEWLLKEERAAMTQVDRYFE